METQQYMGRNQLVKRLTAQVGSKALAIKLLIKRGHLMSDGKTLTKEGRKRNAMTAEERAKDRAAKEQDINPSDFVYDRKTNKAYLK
jgi:hypothetical protein